ncbi:MAG: tyrosine-protein phosphatase [Proteobacteria bacterium]|nr:tyrosine-protein phosphatase [Pseudomonadota bacterium]
MHTPDGERFVALEGCFNFRDLGGYPAAGDRRIRKGLVYRSDGLQELTPDDVRHLRERVGLRTIIDLRTSREAEIDGPGSLAEPPVRYHHVSLVVREPELRPTAERGSFRLDDYYLGLLQSGGERVRQVFELLSETDEPAVFHCAAGKDRTGVISALLLSVLEVPEELIGHDYALTQMGLASIRARLMSSEGYREMFRDLPPETLHAESETILGLLASVGRQWGSPSGYLDSIGIGSERIGRLRERLLEPA